MTSARERSFVPVLIGRGRSFAPPGLGQRQLALDQALHFDGGLVVLEYATVA